MKKYIKFVLMIKKISIFFVVLISLALFAFGAWVALLSFAAIAFLSSISIYLYKRTIPKNLLAAALIYFIIGFIIMNAPVGYLFCTTPFSKGDFVYNKGIERKHFEEFALYLNSQGWRAYIVEGKVIENNRYTGATYPTLRADKTSRVIANNVHTLIVMHGYSSQKSLIGIQISDGWRFENSLAFGKTAELVEDYFDLQLDRSRFMNYIRHCDF